jgi:protease I
MAVDRRQFLAASAVATTVASALGGLEERQMNRPKVLVIVGDATETVDTLYPYYRLIEGGYQPVVAGPEKRIYQMVMHEVKPGWTITKEWEG